jgi:hypothetical protein
MPGPLNRHGKKSKVIIKPLGRTFIPLLKREIKIRSVTSEYSMLSIGKESANVYS